MNRGHGQRIRGQLATVRDTKEEIRGNWKKRGIRREQIGVVFMLFYCSRQPVLRLVKTPTTTRQRHLVKSSLRVGKGRGERG